MLAGPSKPSFELKSWSLATNDEVSIELVYSADKPVEAVLVDPTGTEVSRTQLSAEATRNLIPMAKYGSSPIPGTYRMVVNYLGKRVAEKLFTFTGPKVSIGNVSLRWRYDEAFRWYVPENISVELINDGDLPAYLSGIDAEVDGKYISEGFLMPWIKPGRQTVSWRELWTGVENAGTYTLSIKVEGEGGEVLAERTMSISVP